MNENESKKSESDKNEDKNENYELDVPIKGEDFNGSQNDLIEEPEQIVENEPLMDQNPPT